MLYINNSSDHHNTQSNDVGITVILNLQMREPRDRVLRKSPKGYRGIDCENQHSNPGDWAPESMFLTDNTI